MIETVQERQRGAFNFDNYYDNLCALQDTCPIPAVKAHLNDGILDINGDRIRQHDWNPIFNSIKINKSLRFLAIRSYFQLNLKNGIPEKKAKVMRSRIPIIRTKEMTSLMCKALRDCLLNTENLECIELQGIYLNASDINIIGQGIMKNSTVKHLSLESCRIGDNGLAALCSALKMSGNIGTLNLTCCSLSSIGMHSLGEVIKFQAMSRHNEAWKESLRYRWANFDTMHGIRRLTLNNNIGLGDEGATLLAESLKDDLWLKAIDLQECGLGNAAVRAFLSVLKYNSTLVVLDMRLNPKIDKDLLRSVTEKVLINGNGKETEYKWLRIEDLKKSHEENYERHPRTYYHGPSKPLDYSLRPAFKPAGGRIRSKSVSSLDNGVASDNEGVSSSGNSGRPGYNSARNSAQPQKLQRGRSSQRVCSARSQSSGAGGNTSHRTGPVKGQPMHTAARANRYKGYPPDHVPGKRKMEEQYESPKQITQELENQPRHANPTQFIAPPPPSSHHKPPSTNVTRPTASAGHHNKPVEQHEDAPSSNNSIVTQLINRNRQYPPIPDDIKELKSEVHKLRGQLDKYKKDQVETNKKIKEVCRENDRLRNSMNLLSRTNHIISEKNRTSSGLNNKAILENIEATFNQFDAFLNMLRESGFSKVVSAAGMDEFSEEQRNMFSKQLSSQDPPTVKRRGLHNGESSKHSLKKQHKTNKNISSNGDIGELKDQQQYYENEGRSSGDDNENVIYNGLPVTDANVFHQPPPTNNSDMMFNDDNQPELLSLSGNAPYFGHKNNSNLDENEEINGHHSLADVGWVEEPTKLKEEEKIADQHTHHNPKINLVSESIDDGGGESRPVTNEYHERESADFNNSTIEPLAIQSRSSLSISHQPHNQSQSPSFHSHKQQRYHEDEDNDAESRQYEPDFEKDQSNSISISEEIAYTDSPNQPIKSISQSNNNLKIESNRNDATNSSFNQPQRSIDAADEISLDDEDGYDISLPN